MKKIRFQVPSGVVGRIDKVLADSFPDFSRSHIKRAIEEGRVLSMEGSSVNPKQRYLHRMNSGLIYQDHKLNLLGHTNIH